MFGRLSGFVVCGRSDCGNRFVVSIALDGGAESEQRASSDVFGWSSLSVDHGVSRRAGVAVERFACDPRAREVGPANC